MNILKLTACQPTGTAPLWEVQANLYRYLTNETTSTHRITRISETTRINKTTDTYDYINTINPNDSTN